MRTVNTMPSSVRKDAKRAAAILIAVLSLGGLSACSLNTVSSGAEGEGRCVDECFAGLCRLAYG